MGVQKRASIGGGGCCCQDWRHAWSPSRTLCERAPPSSREPLKRNTTLVLHHKRDASTTASTRRTNSNAPSPFNHGLGSTTAMAVHTHDNGKQNKPRHTIQKKKTRTKARRITARWALPNKSTAVFLLVVTTHTERQPPTSPSKKEQKEKRKHFFLKTTT